MDLASAVQNAIALADQFIAEGRLQKAREVANRLLQIAPASGEFLAISARIEGALGRPNLARALLIRAQMAGQTTEIQKGLEALTNIEVDTAMSDYVANHLALRYMCMDYPMYIQMETVGRCNANCVFCPHETLERKNDEMSDELFEKIIGEIAAFPETIPVRMFMNVVNEPFMDRKIFERLAYINSKVPKAELGFYTNLGVVPKNFLERLKGIKNISSINVSFNAANEAEYHESMRIDFKRTVENIRNLLKFNSENGGVFPKPIHLSRIMTGDQRDGRFLEDCRALFDGFNYGEDYLPSVKMRASWLGSYSGPTTPVPLTYPCMQWFNISILCNGIVPHCCMDAHAQFPLGDLNKQSLLEIYNSPQFRVLREANLARASVYPCNTCSLC